jgi:CheY-like chemotaxis protein
MQPFSKLKNMRTLLVDDDEFVRDSLRVFFESKKCPLLALETAEEGIEALKKQSYDIIITDYRLPGMDGLEFCRRLKRTHPDILLILITAYGSKAVAAEAVTLGIQEFIEKPITIPAIETSLSRLIERMFL